MFSPFTFRVQQYPQTAAIEEEEHDLYLDTHIKIYNSGYSTEIVNEQCNTGDPLETSGGLYRGQPSMLLYVNTIKCCACETLHLVQSSITMNARCYSSSPRSVSSVISIGFGK